MIIEDSLFLEYLKENFDYREEVSFLLSVTSIRIDFVFNYMELLKLPNLENVTFVGINTDSSLFVILSKLKKLKSLSFLDCNLYEFSNLESNVEFLYFNNCVIENIQNLNILKKLESLYLDDIDQVDLNKISVIRNIKNISFMNTKVIGEDKLIFLDKVVNLCLYGTGIENIDTLVENETLRNLVIDKDIYLKNKDSVNYLINRGVSVVDDMNQNVVNSYED